MTQITIRKGGEGVTFPRVKAIQVGAEEVSKGKRMASGKLVKEMLGYRTIVTASWDWIPADILASLSAMLRTGGFFEVEYPTPEGYAKGVFSVSFPTVGIFAFREGAPVWHGVNLTMTAQEVV